MIKDLAAYDATLMMADRLLLPDLFWKMGMNRFIRRVGVCILILMIFYKSSAEVSAKSSMKAIPALLTRIEISKSCTDSTSFFKE